MLRPIQTCFMNLHCALIKDARYADSEDIRTYFNKYEEFKFEIRTW